MVLCIFASIVVLDVVGRISGHVESSNLTSDYLTEQENWYGDSVELPDVLKWKENITLENNLRFDPSACGPGLFLSDRNTHLRQRTVITGNRTCRLMIAGWMHGIHYWSMRIINRGPMGRIILGIVPGHFDIGIDQYPGTTVDSFGFYILNGNKYNNGQPAIFSVELIRSGDVVGVLLDLDAKTLTYFKNGYLLGTAFGQLSVKNNTKFYPTVTFYDLGSWISLIKTFK